MSRPHPFNRFCAALLLGSVLMGVLAPGAVALSRTDIQQAAGQEGLSSDVQDFLNGVLEDAMLRAANVAPASSSTKDTLRSSSDRQPVLLTLPGVVESVAATTSAFLAADRSLQQAPSLTGFSRVSPISPRAP